jgi:hypothetical protein
MFNNRLWQLTQGLFAFFDLSFIFLKIAAGCASGPMPSQVYVFRL